METCQSNFIPLCKTVEESSSLRDTNSNWLHTSLLHPSIPLQARWNIVCFKGGMGTGACPASPLSLTHVSKFIQIHKVVNSLCTITVVWEPRQAELISTLRICPDPRYSVPLDKSPRSSGKAVQLLS